MNLSASFQCPIKFNYEAYEYAEKQYEFVNKQAISQRCNSSLDEECKLPAISEGFERVEQCPQLEILSH